MEIARSGAQGEHPAPYPLPFPDAQCAETVAWVQVVTGLAKAASEHRP